jgi:hypothetical protein
VSAPERWEPGAKYKLLTKIYRRFPPLKYWGLRRAYLKSNGWVQSGWADAPVDSDGDPLPWYTYPSIDFLRTRIKPEMTVFEYGSGQSTRWWARHSESVHAIEDDKEWFTRVRDDLPANVDLRFAGSEEEYLASIGERGEKFDIVVIDGSFRNACARVCLDAMRPDAVVVWDNTEEPNSFGEGLEYLRKKGFNKIDFHGLGPLNMHAWATSVLYRPKKNNFGI